MCSVTDCLSPSFHASEQKDEFADRLRSVESPTPSGRNTIRSSRSVRTPDGGRQKSFVGGRLPESDAKPEPIVVIEVNEPGGHKKKQEGYELTPAEHAYMLEMKEQQDKAKREAEEAAKKLADEREHQEQWEQKMQELKGKDYTFGLSGEIILINAIRPEKLPPSAYPVPAIVHDKFNPDAPQPPQSKSKKKRPNKKGAAFRSKGGPADYFTVSPSLQPPIFEVVTVGTNVTIKQNGNERQGPPPTDDPHHMSRKEYLTKLMGDDQTTAAGSEGDDGMSQNEMSTAGSVPDSQAVDAVDDVSQLTGSPRTQTSDYTFLAGAKKKAAKASTPEYAEPEEDENLKLVKAPDWGAVGPQKEPTIAKLPRKPNPKQRSRTISPRSKKPRDRLAEEAITFTGDSKKLPAPPLGASTGHGFYPRHHASPMADEDGNPLTARSGVSDRSFLPRIPNAQGAGGGASVHSGLTGTSGMHSRSRQYGHPGRVQESVSVASAETAKKLGLR